MTDLAQLRSGMTELTSCTQQMQCKTDILMERNSDRHTAAQISQMQQMMTTMEMHLQQVRSIHALPPTCSSRDDKVASITTVHHQMAL